MDSSLSIVTEPREIQLADLTAAMSGSRWLILWLVILGAGIGFAAAKVFPKSYRATVLISPTSESSESSKMSGLSSVLGEATGLSALAGLSLGSEDSHKAESVAVLKSWSVASAYISENNLLPILYAKQWNSATGTWKGTPPTLWKATKRFRSDTVSVNTDAKTGLVELSVTWSDPRLSAQWSNGLVRLTNEVLRKKSIDEAERDIAYLNDQAAKTLDVGLKQGIYSLIQSQISKEMLARGNDEYAFKVLDPAVVAERPSSPVASIWTAIGAGVALMIGVIIAFSRKRD